MFRQKSFSSLVVGQGVEKKLFAVPLKYLVSTAKYYVDFVLEDDDDDDDDSSPEDDDDDHESRYWAHSTRYPYTISAEVPIAPAATIGITPFL